MSRVIYLIRHTSVNQMEGICYGQSDVELSKQADREFVTVIQKLSEVDPDEIFSSPLSRCTLLAEQLGKPYRTDQRLMEMNFGQWELKSWAEIYDSQAGKAWFEDYMKEVPPGGESFEMLIERVSDFIREYCWGNQTLAIVAHAGTIRAFLIALGLIDREDAFDVSLAYGEVVKISDNRYNYIIR